MIAEQKNTRAQVVTAGLTETKSGKEQIAIGFQLLDGPDAGQSISKFGSLSDAALPYTTKDLRTLGWKDGQEIDTIVSAECKLTIVHEEYEGKTSAKVKWINSITSAPPKLAPARALDAMTRLSAASKALDTKAEAGPLSPEPPYNDPADLPF